jgi:hypothetical protein
MDTLMHLPGFFSHQISLNGLFQQLASGSFLHSQLNFGGGATSSGSSMALWDSRMDQTFFIAVRFRILFFFLNFWTTGRRSRFSLPSEAAVFLAAWSAVAAWSVANV